MTQAIISIVIGLIILAVCPPISPVTCVLILIYLKMCEDDK